MGKRYCRLAYRLKVQFNHGVYRLDSCSGGIETQNWPTTYVLPQTPNTMKRWTKSALMASALVFIVLSASATPLTKTTYSIKGSVLVAATNLPASDVQVYALDVERLTEVPPVTTDQSGKYCITGLRGGKYIIHTVPGKGPYKACFVQPNAFLTDTRTSSFALNFTLVQGATISGLVTDKDTGKPEPGIDVELIPDQRDAVAASMTTTNADGTYTLKTMPCRGLVYARSAQGNVKTFESAPTQTLFSSGNTNDSKPAVGTPSASFRGAWRSA
jgi:hypothetical protein